LGLEGQRAAVEAYAKSAGSKIVAEFVEVESGKRHENRPKLADAIAMARSVKGVLCVAKLDRLARNVAFLSALMDGGCEFVCCDNPNATRLTVHILAAVAEDEARRISERTKAALSAAKARGTLLGSARPGHWKGREEHRLAGAKKATKVAARARSEAAAESNALALQIITKMRGEAHTWQAIADELNLQGHVTRRGNEWTAQTVYQLANKTAAVN
jgi:DNA invertase Pin-like site-specific DNA recombinase